MHRALAERVVSAIERGDKRALRVLYSPHAQFWHNTDGLAHDAEASLGATEAFIDLFSDRRFEDVRIGELPDGFVQQHRVTAAAPDGSRVAFDGCLICQVRDGRIARVEEYVDSAALAPIFAAMTAAAR